MRPGAWCGARSPTRRRGNGRRAEAQQLPSSRSGPFRSPIIARLLAAAKFTYVLPPLSVRCWFIDTCCS